MKYPVAILAVILFVFPASTTELVIEKTDGSVATVAIDEIAGITFTTWSGPPPNRVLFIGNSLTQYCGGVNTHLDSLVAIAHPEHQLETVASTIGGATLQMHYSSDNTRNLIQFGNFDLVILQEQGMRPVDNPELMYHYATLLDELIINAGGATAFFMTWARTNNPALIDQIAAAYDFIGDELGAMVCPVGRAWQRSLTTRPDLLLHNPDGVHPNAFGAYLSACVFYACLFGESPEGIDYTSDPLITLEERTHLQQTAWEAVLLYNPWN